MKARFTFDIDYDSTVRAKIKAIKALDKDKDYQDIKTLKNELYNYIINRYNYPYSIEVKLK